jgi:hypothetical protein
MLAFFSDFRKRMTLPIRGRMLLPKSPGARVVRIRDYYDFATIEKITPAAALIFASEFDRSHRQTGRAL